MTTAQLLSKAQPNLSKELRKAQMRYKASFFPPAVAHLETFRPLHRALGRLAAAAVFRPHDAERVAVQRSGSGPPFDQDVRQGLVEGNPVVFVCLLLAIVRFKLL